VDVREKSAGLDLPDDIDENFLHKKSLGEFKTRLSKKISENDEKLEILPKLESPRTSTTSEERVSDSGEEIEPAKLDTNPGKKREKFQKTDSYSKSTSTPKKRSKISSSSETIGRADEIIPRKRHADTSDEIPKKKKYG